MFVDGALVLDKPAPALAGTPQPGGLAFARLVEGGIECDGFVEEVRVTRRSRLVAGIPDGLFETDDAAVGLWHFDDLPVH